MILQHLTMPAWYEAEILQGTRNLLPTDLEML